MQDLLQLHSTDQESFTTTNDHLHQSLVLHSNDASKRELLVLRHELRNQSDQNILLQHTIEDEQLRRFLVLSCFIFVHEYPCILDRDLE